MLRYLLYSNNGLLLFLIFLSFFFPQILGYAIAWRTSEDVAYFVDRETFVPLILVLFSQLDSDKETNVDNNEGIYGN